MKKTFVLFIAAAVMSIGAVNAADGPISTWFKNTTSSISQKEQETNSKIEAKKQKAALKKAEREKKKAEREKKKAERKKKIEAKKQQWKDLFTVE